MIDSLTGHILQSILVSNYGSPTASSPETWVRKPEVKAWIDREEKKNASRDFPGY